MDSTLALTGLGRAAFYGLAGEIVHAVDPFTEADPVAVLSSFLVAFGNAVGAGPHALVAATPHPARLYVVLVGQSGKSRKGESWSPIRRIMALADPEWASHSVKSGLSSGEGVIAAVRDAVVRHEIDKKTGQRVDIEVDPGVTDKRLLVVEPEFARALRVMRREGNVLSTVLRQGWDDGNLRVMTKQPMVATGAYISIIGHITDDELGRELGDVSLANGLANRHMFFLVERSKHLPRPAAFTDAEASPLAHRVRSALAFARQVGHVTFDDSAGEAWDAAYEGLSRGREGLAGAVVNRLEAQALRLAVDYALLDQSEVIREEHLTAALALTDYAEICAYRIFGDRSGDSLADRILRLYNADPSRELTRTQIRDAFGRHIRGGRIDEAIAQLVEQCRVEIFTVETGGRRAEVVRLNA